MAYYTGTANNVDELVDIIYARATANGFTGTKSPTDLSDGTGRFCYLRNSNGFYLSFYSDNTIDAWNTYRPSPYIYIRMSPSIDGDLEPEDQVDVSDFSRTDGLWGPFVSYHIFVDTDYIQVVVEAEPNIFAHFGYVMHQDKWSYQGGECIYGTDWNYYLDTNDTDRYNFRRYPDSATHSIPFSQNVSVSYGVTRATILRCDVEGVSPRYLAHYNAITNDGTMIGGYPLGTSCTFGTIVMDYSPSTLNGIEQLFPIINGIYLSSKYRLIGSVPNMRSVNISNRTPGESIQYGSDEWMVFPIKKKQTTTPSWEDVGSEVYGYAYKK